MMSSTPGAKQEPLRGLQVLKVGRMKLVLVSFLLLVALGSHVSAGVLAFGEGQRQGELVGNLAVVVVQSDKVIVRYDLENKNSVKSVWVDPVALPCRVWFEVRDKDGKRLDADGAPNGMAPFFSDGDAVELLPNMFLGFQKTVKLSSPLPQGGVVVTAEYVYPTGNISEGETVWGGTLKSSVKWDGHSPADSRR